ncbi:MAG: FkbM family methyltransferase [Acetobacteraceae bacterium]|nr:FkbM family methyltransferase [Acetobacteraceae bacterium]
MPNTVELTLDPACLARVEAYAALKRKTVAEIVNDRLREIGDDFVEAALPRGACRTHIVMQRHEGRDTTASYLRNGRWDEFEQPLPAHLYNWVRRDPGLVIDGGANTGFYALLAANAHADVAVLAFEPDPLVRGLLLANLEANRLGNRIQVSEAALHDETGSAPLYVPPDEFGVIETSSSLEPRFKDRHAQVITVPTVTVDAAAGGRRVTAMKLDLAGHETEALHGAGRTVAADRPLIIIEALDRADFGELSAFIARHEYMDVPLRAGETLTAQAAVTFEKHAWNHALVPAEKLPRFLLLGRAEG